MKRVYVLLLVLLLLFAGCARKEKINNISVEDVCCPYEIKHQKDGIELILRDGGQSEIQWRVETIPEDFCQVTQENIDQENTWRYRLTGKKEGVVQVTFTALRTDETVCFVLTLLVDVDAEGKAEMKFIARYVATNATVTAGTANADSQFTVEYKK